MNVTDLPQLRGRPMVTDGRHGNRPDLPPRGGPAVVRRVPAGRQPGGAVAAHGVPRRVRGDRRPWPNQAPGGSGSTACATTPPPGATPSWTRRPTWTRVTSICRPAGPGHRGRVLRDGRPSRRGPLELATRVRGTGGWRPRSGPAGRCSWSGIIRTTCTPTWGASGPPTGSGPRRPSRRLWIRAAGRLSWRTRRAVRLLTWTASR